MTPTEAEAPADKHVGTYIAFVWGVGRERERERERQRQRHRDTERKRDRERETERERERERKGGMRGGEFDPYPYTLINENE